MRLFICLILIATSAFAQDPSTYLKTFDAKIYSLKTKGVKDFTVDIESSKLTKQLNDQQIFGKVEELVFRVYWTAIPERIAIEIIGLPDGFIEVKEQLKGTMIGMIENLIPPTMEQKFTGHKFSIGKTPKELVAKDSSGVAPIPAYVLKFDQQDILTDIEGKKPVGTFTVKTIYEKESFAEGKLVLKEQIMTTSENGQTLIAKKELSYGKTEGIPVLTEIETSTEQKSEDSNIKPALFNDTIEFKNYKINEGNALRYFLGEEKATPVKK